MKGLDKLSRNLAEVAKATAALDGEIAKVSFNPHDPQSIELAIQQMEAAIDGRMSGYRNNEMIDDIAAKLKNQYRQAILDRAAESRNAGGEA